VQRTNPQSAHLSALRQLYRHAQAFDRGYLHRPEGALEVGPDVQHLSPLDRPLDDRTRKDQIAIDYVLVRDGELSAELLVVLELAGSGQEVQETA
jgi:hypothetical protein